MSRRNSLINSQAVIIVAIILLQTLCNARAHREHKVHNIVLYPDKHSWCKTQTIKQVISYPGCKSVEIDNNVCVGACFSYSIPHTEPSDPGEVIVPYCDSCQPSETTWHHVTLDCDKNDSETPPQLLKRVQIIQNCSCTSCEKDRFNHHKYGDNPDDMMLPQSDIPDLLDALTRNESHPVADIEWTKKKNALMHHKMITLLKNIQANNSQQDKEQLMDLLRMVQGPHQKISDKSIADFVESLNSENIELDIPRLREILIKFEHSKYYEKHKKLNFDTAGGGGGAEHSSEIDGIEGSRLGMDHHLKGSHIGMGLHQLTPTVTASAETDDAGDDLLLASSLHQLHHEPERTVVGSNHHTDSSSSSAGGGIQNMAGINPKHHHHHHIGENVVGHGHHTRGPHGALVIEPDRIHEKLDVNPHELKPNHAGTLLSYHSHSAEGSKNLD